MSEYTSMKKNVLAELTVHAKTMRTQTLSELHQQDPERATHFSASAPGLLMDYSKQHVDSTVFETLLDFAKASSLLDKRAGLFTGAKLNHTEDRAVLHTALRDQGEQAIRVDGVDVKPDIEQVLTQMKTWCDDLHQQRWRGALGAPFTDILCIGIGGSHLGPEMLTEALGSSQSQRLTPHYLTSVDGATLETLLSRLTPHSTLVVIASKTFTTMETMLNAKAVLAWLSKHSKRAIREQVVAISAATDKTEALGISPDRVLTMWDWVGGRFSLWGGIGLPIALTYGFEVFQRVLNGAFAMDTHFKTAPLSQNAPVILALLSFWNTNFMRVGSHAVLPYNQGLHRFPAYLQQAEMESLGKSVKNFGEPVDYVSPIIWGGSGINGQHAFYQYLHQSPQKSTCDFIVSRRCEHEHVEHHQQLIANCFAQSQALMVGQSYDTVYQQLLDEGFNDIQAEMLAFHKVHEGNRSSTTLLLDDTSPESLGSLIALYEHKIFTLGVLLEINAFDQWGVELGKGAAKHIYHQLSQGVLDDEQDSSTTTLLRHCL